jgi:hypothetical protein
LSCPSLLESRGNAPQVNQPKRLVHYSDSIHSSSPAPRKSRAATAAPTCSTKGARHTGIGVGRPDIIVLMVVVRGSKPSQLIDAGQLRFYRPHSAKVISICYTPLHAKPWTEQAKSAASPKTYILKQIVRRLKNAVSIEQAVFYRFLPYDEVR